MEKRPGHTREKSDIALVTTTSSDANSKGDFKETFNDSDVRERAAPGEVDDLPAYEPEFGEEVVVTETKDLITTVIHVDDDETLSPWTFRMFFLGIGLSVFGSVLQEIFYFKPQVIFVSVVFLTVISYVLGEFMALAIPRKGTIGKLLNPGPFNLKEHAAICLMSSAASQSALSTQALAAQQLYYGGYPTAVGGIFITLSTQLIGFGIMGLLRAVLIYPTKMLWPMNIPVTSLLESLHRDKTETKQRLKLFYIVFFALFVWEIVPEYIFPLLQGVSIFCLANQNNLVFTNLFGGSSGNEGLGFLALSFDWQYIASLGSPLWLPLYTLTNSVIGYLGCTILFMGLYYGNIWNSQNFPFMSQLLYQGNSTSTNFVTYDMSTILNPDKTINSTLVEEQGIPWLTGTYVSYLITSNMGLTATFVHMLLWNYNDVKAGWSWASRDNARKLLQPATWRFWESESKEERRNKAELDPLLDPHYKLMLNYDDVPQWWWGSILLISFVVGIVCLYVMKSTLPWWGFIISILVTAVFTLFFGAQMGITGFQFNVQPFCQMLGGYMFPNRPLANMYFTCYSSNALSQAQVLAKDLKLAQYVHLSPRATFTAQVLGCVLGSLFNFVIMLTTVKSQAEVLKSIQGNNIWSGQNIQQFNTLAVAWSIASDMFSIGKRYQWVTISYLLGFLVPFPFWIANKIWPHKFFSYINLSIILWYMGWLFVGVNSSVTMYFIFGFFAQFYLRKYKPQYFVKYNYIVSAALDGGTQVLVFILTFAVFGGGGKSHPFPAWAGNNQDQRGGKNIDFCMFNPSNA